MGRVVGANEFVQFEVKRPGIAVLRILDEEHHKKSDDGGAGVDDELPGVGKMEQRPARRPQDEDRHGEQKHIRMAHQLGRPAGKAAEPETEVAGIRYLLPRHAQRQSRPLIATVRGTRFRIAGTGLVSPASGRFWMRPCHALLDADFQSGCRVDMFHGEHIVMTEVYRHASG